MKNQERRLGLPQCEATAGNPCRPNPKDTVSGSESKRVNTERSPWSLQPGTTTVLQECRLHRHPKGNSEQTLTRAGPVWTQTKDGVQKRQSAGRLAYRGHSSRPQRPYFFILNKPVVWGELWGGCLQEGNIRHPTNKAALSINWKNKTGQWYFYTKLMIGTEWRN